MPIADAPSRRHPLFGAGDVSAFLGLTFDNVAQLIVFSTLLIGVFHFPPKLVLARMLPGTALGVLFGDLIYTWLAFRLARRTGRTDVTAMPLGIDTVSLFGLTFGVLGPAFLRTGDAETAWQVGMALMVMMGGFKIVLAYFAGAIRRLVPEAAMLGTVGAVGVLLIAFLPMLKIFGAPLVGIPALLVVLLSLFRGVRLPGKVPAVLVAVALFTAAYILLRPYGLVPAAEGVPPASGAGFALPLPTLGFVHHFALSLSYLPIALPLAFVTVIGGIDNTASAAAAGDEYDTRSILLTEGISTLLAGLFGGVVQTTPYIGHPAYKRMGGRAGYTLFTALFVGLGGIFGYLAWLVHGLPEVVVVPILVFIGLEIGGLSFRQVPERYAPAVAACFLPVVADLVLIVGMGWLSASGGSPAALHGEAAAGFQAVQLLANGFVFSSLLLGATVSFLIDGRLPAAALTLLCSAAAAFVGLIHSPLPDASLFLPWRIEGRVPYLIAGGYAVAAACVMLASFLPRDEAA
jgi:AGZA family xanthine/uracil permease-like MFS transporter